MISRASGPARPRVTVCVPAYRAERFIGATIESVLAQTVSDWRLVVLDNASPDRTGDIARSYRDPRIEVITNPTTLPLAENWNAVAALATTPYLKLLCADDLIGPECLADGVDVLDRHPAVVMVACRRDFISADGEVVLRGRGLAGLVGLQDRERVVREVVRSGINPIGWPSALLMRRADFEAVGGFSTRWLHPIDLDLWLRLLSRGTLFGRDRSLASFRISEESVTARIGDRGIQHRQVVRAFARESSWDIPRLDLLRGGLRSRLEQIRLRLLFAAVNSNRPWVRRLPALVLEGRRTDPEGPTGPRLTRRPGFDPEVDVDVELDIDTGETRTATGPASHRRA